MGFLRTTENGKAVTQVEGVAGQVDRALKDEKAFRWTGNQEDKGNTGHHTLSKAQKEKHQSPLRRGAPPLSF